jgi:hypothetical protein
MVQAVGGDETHLGSAANPTGLKKASGDSSAGMDAATLKAVAENLVVNGMIDLSAIQVIERNTQSHLKDDRISALSGSRGNEKRSEKINELAFGLSGDGMDALRTDSLGDMMCALMILMIQSTSDRRQIEREMRSLLAVAALEQSKQLKEEILQKTEANVQQIKTQAWGEFAVAVGGTAISMGGAALSAKRMSTKGGRRQLSMESVQRGLSKEREIKGLMQGIGRSAISFGNIGEVKELAQLEESIQRKRTILDLTRSIADSVESSLKSIDSVRDQFLSLLSQIAQAQHDANMRIIRNSKA